VPDSSPLSPAASPSTDSTAEPTRAEDLYRLDPSGFTAARNTLAKKLRAAGAKDEAKQVAQLRRPPATAWALNRIAYDQPALVSDVLEAGALLRAAMDLALSGDASGLRVAQGEERRAVDAAVTEAAAHLRAVGAAGSDAARQRMASTLRAAVVDPAVAEQLRAGLLDSDREAPGFGLDPGDLAPSTPRPPAAGRRASSTKPTTARTAKPTSATDPRIAVPALEEPPPPPPPPAPPAPSAEQRRAEAERRREHRAQGAKLEAAAKRATQRATRLHHEAVDAERLAAQGREAADKAEREAVDARREAEDWARADG
jgi:hypothetical protein